jgi:hypothetical protein
VCSSVGVFIEESNGLRRDRQSAPGPGGAACCRWILERLGLRLDWQGRAAPASCLQLRAEVEAVAREPLLPTCRRDPWTRSVRRRRSSQARSGSSFKLSRRRGSETSSLPPSARTKAISDATTARSPQEARFLMTAFTHRSSEPWPRSIAEKDQIRHVRPIRRISPELRAHPSTPFPARYLDDLDEHRPASRRLPPGLDPRPEPHPPPLRAPRRREASWLPHRARRRGDRLRCSE